MGEQDGQLLFELSARAPAAGPWPVTLRLRDDATTPPGGTLVETESLAAGSTERIRGARPGPGRTRFKFQVGAAPDAESRPFFTRWQSVTR